MKDTKKIGEMTIEEREDFLSALAETLLLSASIAKHEADPIWRELDELGRRLQLNAEAIAKDDTDEAAEFTLTAINLLAKYESSEPRSPTIH